MSRLYVDADKYGARPANLIVDAFHSGVRELVRRKFAESGGDWDAFVFGGSDGITVDDIASVERAVIDSGYRYEWSAMISVRERPEAYKPAEDSQELSTFSFEHPEAPTAPPDAQGREQRGVGDNVSRQAQNTVGFARYVRSSERVIQYMTGGVPPDTIAIIDDSGGTLTAPILEHFKGVICAGGTIRSHLGILTREYGIPCVMNARISGVREGDRIEIETTSVAKTAEDYQTGAEVLARIWRVEA